MTEFWVPERNVILMWKFFNLRTNEKKLVKMLAKTDKKLTINSKLSPVPSWTERLIWEKKAITTKQGCTWEQNPSLWRHFLLSHKKISFHHIWRKKGKALKPQNTISTKKYRGCSIMFWGCFITEKTGEHHKIDDMRKENYVEILKQNLNTSARNLKLGYK